MADIRRFVVSGVGDVDAILATLVDGVGMRVVTDDEFERTWLDTEDRRLDVDGTVLEHRRPTSSDRAASLRWVADGRLLASDDCVTVAPPVSSTDLPNQPGFARLAERLGSASLVAGPVSMTRAVVLALLDDDDKTTVRIVVDRSSVAEAPPTTTLEIVELRGFADEASTLTSTVCRLVPLEPSGDTVLERARRAVATTSTTSTSAVGSTSGIGAIHLDAGVRAGAAWRIVLRSLTDTLVAQLDPAIAGDPHALHRMRVAVRRIRTVLTDADGVLDDRSRRMFRKDFQWIGDITTPTRDADVHLERIPVLIAGLAGERRASLRPFIDVLEIERTRRHIAMVAALRSERMAGIRSEWSAFLDDDAAWNDRRGGVDSTRRATRVVAGHIAAAHRRLERDGRRITKKSKPELLHDLRKRAKHLRYLLECFASLFDAADIETIVQPLRQLQNVLGDFQDSEVEAAELRDLSRSVPAADLDEGAVEDILSTIERRGADARKRFADAFGEFDRRPIRRAVDRLATTKGSTR